MLDKIWVSFIQGWETSRFVCLNSRIGQSVLWFYQGICNSEYIQRNLLTWKADRLRQFCKGIINNYNFLKVYVAKSLKDLKEYAVKVFVKSSFQNIDIDKVNYSYIYYLFIVCINKRIIHTEISKTPRGNTIIWGVWGWSSSLPGKGVVERRGIAQENKPLKHLHRVNGCIDPYEVVFLLGLHS
jgi:hypothetical protein